MARIVICGDFKADDVSKIKISSDLLFFFKNSDLAVCNFEVPIKGYGKAINKSGPVHCQDDRAPEFLKNIGFNLFLVANNHIMDYGREGCEATINALGKECTVGAGSVDEAYALKIRTINGLRIGFLAYVQYEFGVVDNCSGYDCYGAAWVCSNTVEDIIKQSKQKVDFLIICPHAGVEDINAPLPEWCSLYRKFIDWGGDIIIASHPHVPQGWEIYENKYIFYSLGNFYFDKFDGKKYWNTSICVEIVIDGKITITPHIIHFNDGLLDYSFDKSDEKHILACNHLIENEDEYMNYINRVCKTIYKGNIYGILRGVCGISLKVKPKLFFRLLGCLLLNNTDEMYLLNAFQCESHRWVIQRALKNKNKSL